MNTPISELLESKGYDLYTIAPTATVHDAVQQMIAAMIGSVLVVEEGNLVGIFTERDVLVRVVGPNRDPMTTPVSYVMTHDPVTAESTTTVQEVIDLHSGKSFRHLPIVDNGRLVGMVSMRDVMRWLALPEPIPAS